MAWSYWWVRLGSWWLLSILAAERNRQLMPYNIKLAMKEYFLNICSSPSSLNHTPMVSQLGWAVDRLSSMRELCSQSRYLQKISVILVRLLWMRVSCCSRQLVRSGWMDLGNRVCVRIALVVLLVGMSYSWGSMRMASCWFDSCCRNDFTRCDGLDWMDRQSFDNDSQF